MAFEVRLRAREIAVRLALGVSLSTIFRMVLREGAAMVLVGVPALMALSTVIERSSSRLSFATRSCLSS